MLGYKVLIFLINVLEIASQELGSLDPVIGIQRLRIPVLGISWTDRLQIGIYLYYNKLQLPSNVLFGFCAWYSRVWNKRAGAFINFQAFFQGAQTLFQTKSLDFLRKSAFFG